MEVICTVSSVSTPREQKRPKLLGRYFIYFIYFIKKNENNQSINLPCSQSVSQSALVSISQSQVSHSFKSVCLSACPFACLSDHMSSDQSGLSTSQSVHPSVYLSVWLNDLSVYLSDWLTCLSVRLSVRPMSSDQSGLSTSPFVHPSVRLSVWLTDWPVYLSVCLGQQASKSNCESSTLSHSVSQSVASNTQSNSPILGNLKRGIISNRMRARNSRWYHALFAVLSFYFLEHIKFISETKNIHLKSIEIIKWH